jgi:hypothetical protein
MPVRTDIAMIAERIIVFMIVLLESLVHTVAGLGARISDMAHFATANRCCHAPVTNSDHARLKKAASPNSPCRRAPPRAPSDDDWGKRTPHFRSPLKRGYPSPQKTLLSAQAEQPVALIPLAQVVGCFACHAQEPSRAIGCGSSRVIRRNYILNVSTSSPKFIKPCTPIAAKVPPKGDGWLPS